MRNNACLFDAVTLLRLQLLGMLSAVASVIVPRVEVVAVAILTSWRLSRGLIELLVHISEEVHIVVIRHSWNGRRGREATGDICDTAIRPCRKGKS